MRRSAMVVAVALAASGCGWTGEASYKPPIVPVEFKVDTTGKISVEVGHDIVTPIGTFGVSAKPADEPDSGSVVSILHYEGGESKQSRYTVKLDDTLYVAVNGEAHLRFAGRTVEIGAKRGTQTTIRVGTEPLSEDSYTEPTCPAKAPAPELTLTPERGPASTKIAMTGVGFVSDGKVDITFHATNMGEARTDCAGRFTVTLPIPDPSFYRKFPGRQSISTTEHDGSGTYTGNGDTAYFELTG